MPRSKTGQWDPKLAGSDVPGAIGYVSAAHKYLLIVVITQLLGAYCNAQSKEKLRIVSRNVGINISSNGKCLDWG